VVTNPLAPSLELSREAVQRFVERGPEGLTTAMCNDTVAAFYEYAGLHLLVAMIGVELDHDIVDARLVTLQARNALLGIHTNPLGNIAMTGGDVDLHNDPHVAAG
jgi:hypothetical protein